MVFKPLRLKVLTPAEILLDAEGVAWVKARLADGSGIGIYPGHAPLLAETMTAPLHYADRSGEYTLNLEAGILQVDREGVTLLTSGLAQVSEVSETSEVAAGARFSRLSAALLATIQHSPEGR